MLLKNNKRKNKNTQYERRQEGEKNIRYMEYIGNKKKDQTLRFMSPSFLEAELAFGENL